MKWLLLPLLCWIGIQAGATEVDPPVQHELTVSIHPTDQTLSATDRVTLPTAAKGITLDLQAGLNPRFSSPAGKVEIIDAATKDYRTRYRLRLPGDRVFDIEYQGRVHHSLSSSRAERARGFRNTLGLIDEQGVFLSAATLWYPQIIGHPYLSYSMQVDLPAGWSSVSQGERSERQTGANRTRERWSIDSPQEEIYLIAAPFTEYSRSLAGADGTVDAQVFLRRADPKLAGTYLDATTRYLRMYEKLLGPYPYRKFALVENFWESGFGMPSFTLLGPRVIRLPFIVNSSYPHEILHNWWGNGVYVDFESGNWSEGLTSYLADHLIKQQQGRGADYRQQSLQKYRDYAAKNRDFPLSRFHGRHSSASAAVGYGKALMLFHMLRNKVGDQTFVNALRRFYRDYRFRIASFEDVRRVFEQESQTDLRTFFDQWVQRTGAPELVLQEARVEQRGTAHKLTLTIAQVQPGPPYQLDIPLAVSLRGRQKTHQAVVRLSSGQQTFELTLPAAPTRLDIDPQFDLFRKLAAAEIPPAFTQLFGAPQLLVVLPRQAPDALKPGWRAFAKDLAQMGPEQVDQVWDDEIDALPDDRAVAVLGWRNRFAPQLQTELRRHSVVFEPNQVRIGTTATRKRNHAFAWVTRSTSAGNGSGESHPHALIAADRADALPGLGRKLPHYHKYSYLAFAGDEPENRLKGRWPVTDSPMTVIFEAGAERAGLDKPAALSEAETRFDIHYRRDGQTIEARAVPTGR